MVGINKEKKMTQELDKNGRPKIYCANCGKRMAYTSTQQWFGCDGYKHWSYWNLYGEEGGVFSTRAEAEIELQRLEGLGYINRGWDSVQNRSLKVDSYDRGGEEYYVEYSEPIGEPVPYQFHSQQCMMEFLQRPDIIRQIVTIIEANRVEPVIPAKKPRKKREAKIDLPDYESMEKRISSIL